MDFVMVPSDLQPDSKRLGADQGVK
jgi:hypothetical protein